MLSIPGSRRAGMMVTDMVPATAVGIDLEQKKARRSRARVNGGLKVKAASRWQPETENRAGGPPDVALRPFRSSKRRRDRFTYRRDRI